MESLAPSKSEQKTHLATNRSVSEPITSMRMDAHASYDSCILAMHSASIGASFRGLGEASASNRSAYKGPDDHTVLGMFLVTIGAFFFCSVAAIVKYYNGSVTQLLIFRYLVQHIIAWIVWFQMKKFGQYRENNLGGNVAAPAGFRWQLFDMLYQAFDANTIVWYGNSQTRFFVWLRAAVYWVMIYTWWRGVELVAIGTAECIIFLSPFLIVILAKIILNESIPISFYICIVPALASLILMTQPDFIFDLFEDTSDYENVSALGMGYLVISTLAASFEAVLVRKSKSAHWLQLELVTSLMASMILTPLVLFIDWLISDPSVTRKIEGSDSWDFDGNFVLVCFGASVLGFFALMFYVIGFQIANATKAAFMMYLELVFAFAYQIILFGDSPNLYESLGAVLLVLCCLVQVVEQYLLERRQAEREGYTQIGE